MRVSRLLVLALLAMTACAPAATAAAPAGSLRLYLHGAFGVAGQTVSVPGRRVEVEGILRPWVAGQKVSLQAYEGGRRLSAWMLAPARSRGGTFGRISVSVAAPAVGTVMIRAVHEATRSLGALNTRTSYSALDERVGFGSRGRFVELVQERLAALHIYLPRSGVYDGGTGLAVDAYHRLLRRGTSQLLDHATVVWLLNGWGAFHVRFPTHGFHAEGDLRLQLLALSDGPRVSEIFPISSGKPSTPTILGDFRIYQRTPGYLPDGMYYSSFFSGGYAIHGYDPAPDYPASHGCMRLPITDAVHVYYRLAYGDWVDVYR